jgi:hypothetical protein
MVIIILELEQLLKDIETLKKNLNDLISEKGANLQDQEIIAASQILNTAIVKYSEIINKKLS